VRWRLLAAGAWATLGLGGCADLWDEVTSRDRDLKTLVVKPDPLVVLRDSSDGDKRAKAFAVLREPKQAGGSDRDQEFVLEVLTRAAESEPHFVARLAAVRKLGEFQDPRAVPALVEAYYKAGAYRPDKQKESLLRCQALTSLGDVGHPSGMELLVRVLRQGPVEGPEQDRQMALDERMAAARALARFRAYPAADVLAEVLRNEKDVALRACAHESLQACTGAALPADGQAWEDYLRAEKGKNPDRLAGGKKGLKEFLLTGFGGNP
jgi:HEAT repeat protein